ncbi:MAG: YceI family protein [Saprospiraceae bacterium]|nr:YceI family protein [Saprospiraceae bacterium]
MKQLLFIAALSLAVFSCKKKDTVEAKDATGTEVTAVEGAADVAVNAAASTLWWKGTKKIGGGHEGNIPVKTGTFKLKDGSIVGSEFEIDVAGLTSTDLEPGKGKEDLESHLKNADFFDVEKFPTATFKIIGQKDLENDENGNTHQLSGTLTIKNTAKVIDIPAKVAIDGEAISLESTFNIDRTDFGVVYGSEGSFADLAKDRVINDAVELKVMVKS